MPAPKDLVARESWKKQISEFQKKRFRNPENHPLFGKSRPVSVRKKISMSLKEKYKSGKLINPNKGKSVPMSTRLKQSRVRKQKIASGEIVIPDSQIKKMISARNKIASRDSYRKKLSESIIKRMKAGKYNMRPNLSEMFLHDILNQLYPNQWKYTGDGKFWINNQNPDFIHKKNKLIIELFGDYWHKIRKKTSVKLRVSKYSDYGYDSLVLWFSELRDSPEEIINKIEGFIDGSLSNDKFKAI